MKVSEASGHVLDWMVAKALGLGYRYDDKYGPMCFRSSEVQGSVEWDSAPLPYSTDWAHGGPIIEREGLWVRESAIASPAIAHLVTPDKKWFAYAKTYPTGCVNHCLYGETFLVAAMRCFVASKLGDEVEVPEEMVT